MLNELKKILFSESEEDNIYRNYAPHEREIVFHFFFFFGKRFIKNKPYFYKSFPLIKDSFPLKFLFIIIIFYYQTLENVKNYFYKRFSSKTNKASFFSKLQSTQSWPKWPSTSIW